MHENWLSLGFIGVLEPIYQVSALADMEAEAHVWRNSGYNAATLISPNECIGAVYGNAWKVCGLRERLLPAVQVIECFGEQTRCSYHYKLAGVEKD